MAMMDVFVRPPSESCRILVSLDSLWKEQIHEKRKYNGFVFYFEITGSFPLPVHTLVSCAEVRGR